MEKLKNWLAPILLSFGAILDIALQGLEYAATLIEVPENWANYVRIVIFVAGLIIAKNQLPSRNPEKVEEKLQQLKADKYGIK